MRSFLLLIVLSVPLTPIHGQNKPTTPKTSGCGSASTNKSKRRRLPPLSFGVLNGKALTLVKPEYPRSASQLNVHGTVTVQVMIDEAGCVTDATVISGHPLLLAAAVKAAIASSFIPVLIDNKPRRVTGTITYIFLPNLMNWLELGFVSDSLTDLLDYLPFERSNLRAIIKNVPNERLRDRAEVQKIDELIDTELSGDLKDQWLFRLGQQLKTIQNSCWSGCNESMVNLSNLIDQAPSGVSADLLTRLRQLVSDNNLEMVGSRIQFLKDRLFDLGN
jgi:TonB family C-terminal domain